MGVFSYEARVTCCGRRREANTSFANKTLLVPELFSVFLEAFASKAFTIPNTDRILLKGHTFRDKDKNSNFKMVEQDFKKSVALQLRRAPLNSPSGWANNSLLYLAKP